MSNSKIIQLLQQALTAQKQNNIAYARQLYHQILKLDAHHGDTRHYLALLEFEHGDKLKALPQLELCCKQYPERSHYWQNLGNCYFTIKRYQEALDALLKAVQLSPGDALIHGNLVKTYKQLQQYPLAQQHGQICLELQDKKALADNILLTNLPALHKRPHPGSYQASQKNIISFSLWGDNPLYCQGAVINAALARYIYPEWRCRFYCAENVAQEIILQLKKWGAEVVIKPLPAQPFEALVWRFLAAEDPTVTRFICRDADSRLNIQEKIAVDDWVNSTYFFHGLRGDLLHCELILAGLWGGVAGILPINKLIQEFHHNYHVKWYDQHFTRRVIWPLIKEQLLTHDDYYHLGHVRRYPTTTRLLPPWHVGAVEQWDLALWA